MGHKKCCKLCMSLVLIGALNWGLVGLSNLAGMAEFNLVTFLLGSWPVVENIVYALVGVAAVAVAAQCGKCSGGSC